MSDWQTHREIIEPPVMSGEQIDRLYHILLMGMGLAFLAGMLLQWGLGGVFGWCG